MFYTYAHYRETDGKCFYIGKGQRRRAYSKADRSDFHKKVAGKHGMRVEILANWPTEQEAFDHEVLLIKCFTEIGHPLVNQTAGGEGKAITCPLAKARHVAAAKAAFSSPEARARMSAAAKASRGTPKSRAKTSAASKTLWADPEYRMRQSAVLDSILSNKELLAKRAATLKATLATPEAKARISAATKKSWADPEHRAKQTASRKAAWVVRRAKALAAKAGAA